MNASDKPRPSDGSEPGLSFSSSDVEEVKELPPSNESESPFKVLRDPGARNYLFSGLSALAILFVIMFQRGSDLGGLMMVAIGAGGLVFRWPSAPVFLLFVLTYFLIFPFGLPPADENPFEIEDGRFRVTDLVLVASVVVYLASHYRIYGIAAQAFPPESKFPRPGDKPVRRPAAMIRPEEVTRLLYLTIAMVVAGQLVWLFVSGLEVDALGEFPLKVVSRQRYRAPTTEFPLFMSRFVLLSGLLFFGSVLVRLAFGYWGLRRMGSGEARMVLQDTAWSETRRERVRVEMWRTQVQRQAEARAKENGQRDGEDSR